MKQLLFVFSLCFLGSGCRLFHNAWQTTIAEPIQYSPDKYEKCSRRRFRDLAARALEEATFNARAELDNYGCEPYSVDYQLGFIDGFVDLLEAGGSGNPSPLPPRRYWKAKYQNPAGYQRTQDWFRGFQHGAGAAQASNYRSYVTVPLSDSVTADTMPYPYGRISAVEQLEEADEAPEGNDGLESDEGNYANGGIRRLPEIAMGSDEDPPYLTRVPQMSTTQ